MDGKENSGSNGKVDILGRPLSDDGSSIGGNRPADAGRNNSDGNGDGIIETGDTINGIKLASADTAGTGTGTGSGADEPGAWGFRADGTPRNKPGRKPGAGTGSGPRASKSAGKKANASSSSVNGLEKILFSIHAIIAVKGKIPELAIDAQEANMMARAINDVQEFYGLEVSEKVTIWVNLVTALGTVYAPRFVSISVRKSREKKHPESKPSATVTPINAKAAQAPKPDVMPAMPGMHDPLL